MSSQSIARCTEYTPIWPYLLQVGGYIIGLGLILLLGAHFGPRLLVRLEGWFLKTFTAVGDDLPALPTAAPWRISDVGSEADAMVVHEAARRHLGAVATFPRRVH